MKDEKQFYIYLRASILHYLKFKFNRLIQELIISHKKLFNYDYELKENNNSYRIVHKFFIITTKMHAKLSYNFVIFQFLYFNKFSKSFNSI